MPNTLKNPTNPGGNGVARASLDGRCAAPAVFGQARLSSRSQLREGRVAHSAPSHSRWLQTRRWTAALRPSARPGVRSPHAPRVASGWAANRLSDLTVTPHTAPARRLPSSEQQSSLREPTFLRYSKAVNSCPTVLLPRLRPSDGGVPPSCADMLEWVAATSPLLLDEEAAAAASPLLPAPKAPRPSKHRTDSARTTTRISSE